MGVFYVERNQSIVNLLCVGETNNYNLVWNCLFVLGVLSPRFIGLSLKLAFKFISLYYKIIIIIISPPPFYLSAMLRSRCSSKEARSSLETEVVPEETFHRLLLLTKDKQIDLIRKDTSQAIDSQLVWHILVNLEEANLEKVKI